MNSKRYKKLKEVAEAKNKTLLVESFDFSVKDSNKFNESVDVISKQLKEAIHQEEGIDCLAIVRKIPVSRYTQNRNGRTYPINVWQKIERDGSFENGFCLADHADEEGSVTRIAGVWKNFRVEEEAPYADLYCLDNEHGKRIIQILKVNGKVGFSTVGFGELDESDNVIAESFEMSEESVCDHVLVPSQGVFATNENLTSKKADSFMESKLELTNKEECNDITENKISEGDNRSNMENKELTESVIKNNTYQAIKEATKNSDKTEAIRDLKEFRNTVPSSMKEQLDKVDNAIEKIAENLSVELKSKDEKLTESAVSSKKLSEKYKEIGKLYTDLREKHKKTLSVTGKMKEQLSKVSRLSEALRRDKSLMEKDISVFRKERFMMLEDVAKFLVKEGRIAEAKNVKQHLKDLREKKLFQSRIAKFVEFYGVKEEEEILEPVEDDFFDEPEMEETYDDFVMVDEEESFEGDSLGGFEQGFAEEEDEEETEYSFDEEDETEDEELVLDEEEAEEEELDFEEEAEYEDEEEDSEELVLDEEDDSEELDFEEEAEEDDEFAESLVRRRLKRKVRESARKPVRRQVSNKGKMKVKKEVLSFYESAVATNPSIKDIRGHILKCKTMKEAYRVVDAFTRSAKRDNVSKAGKKKVKESKAPSWLGSKLL